MRKHITQAEVLRIEKLLNNGVTDMAEIQTVVFVHSACIQQVVDKFNNQSGAAVAEAPVDAPPKRRRKKAAPVDPLS
jgi:hypothetical protein